MKRGMMLLLTVLLLLSLSACVQDSGQNNDGRLKVVTTIFPPYDFVRAVAGDAVSLTMLLPTGGESHSYEPTPQDMRAVAECDLFIGVGGPSEHWADELLGAADSGARTELSLLDMVEVIDTVHAHNGDAHAAEPDEHPWTSPRNAAVMVEEICAALCTLDPDRAGQYRGNADAYLTELAALDAEFSAIAAGGVRRTVVFGDRFPFRYLTEAYGLTAHSAYPGCAAEGEPAPATVAALIELVRTEHIPVVFCIEFSTGAVAQTICDVSGAQVMMMHSCHNVSTEDFAAGVTYLDLMRANAGALRAALHNSQG